MIWKLIAIGTTSARSAKMDDKMIDLIESIDGFWKHNSGKWKDNQLSFANFLIKNGFMNSKLVKKEQLEKFARQKTSYLEQLGFIDSERRKTNLGNYLSKPEEKDKILSFLNNKQVSFLIGVLNYYQKNIGYVIRNLITYLIERNENLICKKDFILNFLILNKKTDEELYDYVSKFGFVKDQITFSKILHHQKGDKYNKKYFELYRFIKENIQDPKLVFKKMNSSFTSLTARSFKIMFFGTTKIKNVKNFSVDLNNDSDILVLMLKAKCLALGEEYFDLNKRTLIATGIFSFDDENTLYISDIFLDLVKNLKLNNSTIIKTSNDIFINSISNLKLDNFKVRNIQEDLEEKRSKEFEKYLDEKLTFKKIKEFIFNMTNNDYSLIAKFFNDSGKDNATYAEFLISVAFHYLTNRKNNFILAWNGTLNSDNSPKRHASGNVPDAQFSIMNKVILVETTIQTGMAQTTNEISSISKHLYNINCKNKMAVLFAKTIFFETARQSKIYRNNGELIYNMNFLELYNILNNSELTYKYWEEKIINV